MVLSVCTEIHTYVPDAIRHWHQLVRAAETVRPMMEISVTAWNDAIVAMGAEGAAVVVIAMLERFSDIQSLGGYLRHLTRRAKDDAFSCGPMIMALMRREAA
jgi:replication initiation protein RepC